MPALDFPQSLERYGMQLLGVSNTDVLPGGFADKKRKGFMPQGHLQEILTKQPAGFWDTEIRKANLGVSCSLFHVCALVLCRERQAERR